MNNEMYTLRQKNGNNPNNYFVNDFFCVFVCVCVLRLFVWPVGSAVCSLCPLALDVKRSERKKNGKSSTTFCLMLCILNE